MMDADGVAFRRRMSFGAMILAGAMVGADWL
jgi:hypothetical protein